MFYVKFVLSTKKYDDDDDDDDDDDKLHFSVRSSSWHVRPTNRGH